MDVFPCGTDFIVASGIGFCSVAREVGRDGEFDKFTPGEIKEFGGGSDEWIREEGAGGEVDLGLKAGGGGVYGI